MLRWLGAQIWCRKPLTSLRPRAYSRVSRIETADSPVDVVQFNNKLLYIKRDDLLSPYYPGNKYRKLFYFMQQLQAHNTPLKQRWTHLIGYGGNQSNLMLAAAHLAREHHLQFIYYTKRVSEQAKNSSAASNWHVARDLGMHVIECQTEHEAQQLFSAHPNQAEFLKLGRAEEFMAAEFGIKQLAESLHQFITTHLAERQVSIVIPAGTGATAYFVHRHLQHLLADTCQTGTRVTVYAVPVVSDAQSLLHDMTRMASCHDMTATGTLPHVLNTRRRYHFAAPHRDLWEVHQEISKFGIEFDMVYAPKAWRAVFEHSSLFAHSHVLYCHTGGVSGNSSQLQRYTRALNLDVQIKL